MKNILHFEDFLTPKLIATVVIFVVLLLARYFIARYIRAANRNWTSQQRLRWIGATRSISFVTLLLLVLFLWGETIQGFAVSVFAIAFAMVFAVKELCISFNGAIHRIRGHIFDIGDRIQVLGVRGDVIDTTLLTTTILEVGVGPANHQYTGRRISFANSRLLENAVINESFLGNFYMNNINIPLKLTADWKRGKQVLQQIAEEESAPYLDQARRRLRQMERSRSIELPSVEPRVTVHVPTCDEVNLHLRIPSPAHLKGRLEQVIVTRFLEQFYAPPPQE